MTIQYANQIIKITKNRKGTNTIHQVLCIYLLVTSVKATANLILLHITRININQIAAKAVNTQKKARSVVSLSASISSSFCDNNLKYTANTINPA